MRGLLSARSLFAVVLTAALSTTALAQEEGIDVVVKVVDPAGAPIAAAVVRHPMEEERHRVNTVTGEWSANVLYMPDGTSLVFTKGLELKFEVSAPGYELEEVNYLVRKRKNLVLVTLAPMPEEDEEEEMDIPIGFGRSVPLDGSEPVPESE